MAFGLVPILFNLVFGSKIGPSIVHGLPALKPKIGHYCCSKWSACTIDMAIIMIPTPKEIWGPLLRPALHDFWVEKVGILESCHRVPKLWI
jgi:hypothetical protein